MGERVEGGGVRGRGASTGIKELALIFFASYFLVAAIERQQHVHLRFKHWGCGGVQTKENTKTRHGAFRGETRRPGGPSVASLTHPSRFLCATGAPTENRPPRVFPPGPSVSHTTRCAPPHETTGGRVRVRRGAGRDAARATSLCTRHAVPPPGVTAAGPIGAAPRTTVHLCTVTALAACAPPCGACTHPLQGATRALAAR